MAGANAEAGLGLLTIVLTLAGSLLFPLGASPIAAAIVIQTLAGARDRWSGESAERAPGAAEPSARE